LKDIALENEIGIFSGKVSIDHIHMLIPYRPTQNISKIMQRLKGIISRTPLSEFAHLKKQFWGKHLWAQGYRAISFGNIAHG